ncbi:MAG TPA: hypothetical protein VNY25_00580 [Steroidobacteraceae bacterium]|jgi:hypothetical protein|nr:hypothetical protein [Steroidobacteraceae bacterium]
MTGPTDANGRKVATLRELPTSIEPARDLWPRIEAQLEEVVSDARGGAKPLRRRGEALRWLALAAMLASLAVGVWIGRSLLPGAGGETAPATAANRSTVPALAPTAFDAAYVSDPRYERQRAALVRALQERLAALPLPARTKVSASLAAIEKAKKDLEQALGHDPGNALLQELLINTYQDEMRVLSDVHEASDPGRGI